MVARMLVGLVVPTTGEAEVLGTPMGPGAFAVFERVGFGGAQSAFLGGLSAKENLLLAAALRGAAESMQGTLQVESASRSLRESFDPFGAGDAALFGALKSQFDPRGTLNPGLWGAEESA